MNSKKGMSLISVVIMILVLVIITSITVFTGLNMVENSRLIAANDRLEAIYQALAAYEKELGFGDTVLKVSLSKDDYSKMQLDELVNEFESIPTVYVEKKIGTLSTPNPDDTDSNSDGVTDYEEYVANSNDINRTYTLTTTTRIDGGTECKLVKTYQVDNTLNSLNISFDYSAGVNRPIVSSKMTPIVYDVNNEKRYVEDIYLEDWYSYSKLAPKWAIAEFNGSEYIWIPRYAYKIQEYYLNTDFDNVPSTAIDVLFLKETTNFLGNGESMPQGYKVHPAFQFGGEELPGIWIERTPGIMSSDMSIQTVSDVFGNISDSSYFDLSNSAEVVITDVHLCKNVERGAATYLLYSIGINEFDNLGTVQLPNLFYSDEIVSAYLDDTSSSNLVSNGAVLLASSSTYVGRYNSSNLSNKYGDAMNETSSGIDGNFSWNNSVSNFPTIDEPFVSRSGLFGYTSSVGNEAGNYFRNVIVFTSDSLPSGANIAINNGDEY